MTSAALRLLIANDYIGGMGGGVRFSRNDCIGWFERTCPFFGIGCEMTTWSNVFGDVDMAAAAGMGGARLQRFAGARGEVSE